MTVSEGGPGTNVGSWPRPVFERREVRVAWELHRAVAAKIEADRDSVVAVARKNLARMRQGIRSGFYLGWLDEWEKLLEGDQSMLFDRMLADDERAIDMRQVGPFVGVLTQAERIAAIRRATGRG